MGKTKCKTLKKGDLDPKRQEKNKKYSCKKCNLSSNNEKKLCKPVKI
jgi:hypothetical protein